MKRSGVFGESVACLEILESRLMLSVAVPQLPQLHVDTTYVAPSGSVLNVDAAYGGNFQSALNAAQPGDVIQLTAGHVYSSSTGFVLPAKSNPNGKWIIIRSSSYALLPAEGTRVGSAQASLMPKVISTNTDGADSSIHAANQANYYRIVGVELYRSATYTDGSIVDLGDISLTSVAQQPHHMIIDHCYIHGVGSSQVRRGVSLQGSYMAVIDSTISHIQHGSEPQAVWGLNGPGPYRIANNFLEASGENVFFGGADVKVPNLIPSDIEIVHNLISKDLTWRGGPYTVKNLLELKNAQRVLIEGNIFENTWEGQGGQYYAIVLTPRAQSGANPWNDVRDITIRDNIVRHAASGINILAHSYSTGGTQITQRILIENNLFYDIGTNWGNGATMIQLISSDGYQMTDVTIRHNTMMFSTGGKFAISIDTGPLVDGYAPPVCNHFIYVDNIVKHGASGIFGRGTASGNATINKYLVDWTITKNAFLDGGSAANYPAGNFFYTTAAVKFTNAAAGNYSLQSTSPLKAAGSDGQDVGTIWPVLSFMTQGVSAGQPAVPPPGDANRDGVVDMADYSAWFNNYGKTGAQLSDGDFDQSGAVDATDYAMWFNNYGLGGGASAQAATAAAKMAAPALTVPGALKPAATDLAAWLASSPAAAAGYEPDLTIRQLAKSTDSDAIPAWARPLTLKPVTLRSD